MEGFIFNCQSAFISYNINLEAIYLFFVIPNIVRHRVHVCSWPLLAPAAKQVTVHWPQPWVAWPMGRWRSSQAGQITLHFYIPSQVYISSLHLKIRVSWSLFKLKLHSIGLYKIKILLSYFKLVLMLNINPASIFTSEMYHLQSVPHLFWILWSIPDSRHTWDQNVPDLRYLDRCAVG